MSDLSGNNGSKDLINTNNNNKTDSNDYFNSNNNNNNNNNISNMDTGSSTDDTHAALLEQLVYMDNNIYHLGDSPMNSNAENYDDIQLQRELAAFATDTFIFPDEDKPKHNLPSNKSNLGNGINGNGNFGDNRSNGDDSKPNSNLDNHNNNLLLFAQNTFNHLSPADASNGPSPIPQTHYQNLSQRYNVKPKTSYQETMAQHMASIPSTINELLGGRTNSAGGNASRNNIENVHGVSNTQPISISPSNSLMNNSRNNTNSTNTNTINIETRKVSVPQGAQNTLAAAGLSQTQIDALASLVAFHKGEDNKPPTPQNQSNMQSPFASQIIQNPLISSPSLQNYNPLPSYQQQPAAIPQQIQTNAPNNVTNVNGLLVNLLAQTLATAINPISQQQQQQQQQPNVLAQLLGGLSNGAVPSLDANSIGLALQLQQQQLQQQQQQQQLQQQQQQVQQQQQHRQLQQTNSSQSQYQPQEIVQQSNSNVQSMNPQSEKSNISSKTLKKNTLTFKNSHLDISNGSETNVRKSTSSTSNNTPKSDIAHATNLISEKDKSLLKGENSDNNSSDNNRSKGNASVRFRQKKKQKEQEMEKSLIEAKEYCVTLEAKIKELQMENNLLRGLVMEKSQKRDSDEVESIRKKARTQVEREEKT